MVPRTAPPREVRLGSLRVESTARFALGGLCREASAGVYFSYTGLPASDCPYRVILKPAYRSNFNRFTASKAWRVDTLE